MAKIDYISRPEDSEITRPAFKITLPLLFISLALIAVHFTENSDILTLIFKDIENYQLWRLFSSFLSSLTLLDLEINMAACFLLTFVNERVNGSGYYFIDLLTKNFLINLLSLFMYIVLLCCSIVFDSKFNEILAIQNQNPTSGLIPVLLCELTFLVLNFVGDGEEWIKSNFSKAVVFLLGLLQILIFYTSWNFIWCYSAFVLAVLLRLKWIDYASLIENIGCLKSSRKRMYNRLMYPTASEQAAQDFYEANENVSFDMKKESGSHEPESTKEDELRAEEDHENSKSRYDSVNVKDYILENKVETDEIQEQESFEI